MNLTTTLSHQGGRRYPQMNGLAAVQLQRLSGAGTSANPVVRSLSEGASIDMPAIGTNAPPITFGDPGFGG